MKNLVLPQLLLFASLIIASCKKKNDIPTLPGDNNTGKLKSIKIQTAPKEYDITTYDYDAKGRVSRVRSFTVDSAASPLRTDSGTTITYFYSTGIRPTGYNYYEGGAFLFSGTLTFDAGDQLIRDSTNTSPTGYVSKLRYAFGIAVATTTVTPGGGFPPFTQTDSIYVSSGNINRYASTQTLGISEQASVYTYGTLQSPLYDLNITYGIPRDWGGLNSKNLPVTEQYFTNNRLEYTSTYTHTTGSNGKVNKSTIASSGITISIFWEYY